MPSGSSMLRARSPNQAWSRAPSAMAQRQAVLGGDGVVEPEDDRLLRRGDDSLEVRLLEVPPVAVADHLGVAVVVGEVLVLGVEEADARVGQARAVAVVLELEEVEVD